MQDDSCIIAAMKRMIILAFLALLQTGCATVENDFDPLEPMNRKIDAFNTAVDEATLRPLAKGYTAVVPKGGRDVVTNFFHNLQEPNTIINDVLQGKLVQSLADSTRFVLNSTLGVLGLFDVASQFGLERHDEDFGQTLAVWGVGQGAYIVYPLLGPNSVRNTPGTVMGYYLDGASYFYMVMNPPAVIAATALKYINDRANIEDFVKMRDEMALDAYVFVREGWRQSREYRIYDGHPPTPPSSEDDDFEDEFSDEFN
jgi:phospholipid-binding lipoprotein MlaA